MKLTKEQKKRFLEMHADGKTAATIALYLNGELGMSLKAERVHYLCGKLRLSQPKESPS